MIDRIWVVVDRIWGAIDRIRVAIDRAQVANDRVRVANDRIWIAIDRIRASRLPLTQTETQEKNCLKKWISARKKKRKKRVRPYKLQFHPLLTKIVENVEIFHRYHYFIIT